MTPNDVCLICGTCEWKRLDQVRRNDLTFNICTCRGCGFVAQIPPLSADTLKAYYANDYNERNYMASMAQIHETMIEPGQHRLTYMERMHALDTAKRALEIGPGAGSLMKLLDDRGLDVEGIEADPTAAQWIREKLGLSIFNGWFDTAFERRHEDWERNRFDLILLVHVFEHIVDVADFLQKLGRILSPNGRLFIEVPNILRPFSDQREWQHYCDPGHLYYFSANSLAALLQRHGFTVLDVTDNTMRPYRNVQCIAQRDGTVSRGAVSQEIRAADEVTRIWRRFVRSHPVRWYLRYGWRRDVKRAMGRT